MAQVDKIAEQTRLLLDEQKLVLKLFKDEFSNLSDLISNELSEAEKTNDGSLLESCQHVKSLIDDLDKEIVNQIEEDVVFLEEQCVSLEKIKELPDKSQADEIASMMLEDGTELPDIEEFKENVKEESEAARESFMAMMDDMKAVLEEDGIAELEALLEAHAMAAKESAGDEDVCDEEECSDDSSSCSGCDVFAGLNDKDDEAKDK